MDSGPPAYPAHWEADVVLRDGGTAHIRPIRPDDAEQLARFHHRLSEETIYFRFFSLVRELSEQDLTRFTVLDYVDRVALVATVADQVIGVVRYERIDAEQAEVAFNIEDAHQGRGLGSVFLEHIAAAARERGISRFVADVLPNNHKMLRVFEDAGYVVAQALDDGVVRLSFDLEPTEDSLAVTYAREHRAEARSVERLLRPRSVAVVGASRGGRSVGSVVLRHIIDGGFQGAVYAVNPHTDRVGDVACYPTVAAVPGDVDLVVVAVPAAAVDTVVEDCAVKGVLGLVVMTSGFAETGADEDREHQRRLVSLARGSGMRVVGPSSFGIINADAAVVLNATLAPRLPPAGRVGVFAQSGALGVALLDNVVARGLGLSSFVSAGNRVDVSGNDLMQFWEEDEGTDAVLLYLESLGNPRKFSRIARRLARRKPVVVVKSGRVSGRPPIGHLVRQTRAPAAALDALFRQAGVIRVPTIHQLFDVGQLVAHQPLPAGPRVAVVGNSEALGRLAVEACDGAGLLVTRAPEIVPGDVSLEELAGALGTVVGDDRVDAVVAVFIPTLRTPYAEVAVSVADLCRHAGKTVVSSFLGIAEVPRGLPSYPTPEDAVRALADVTTYARWRDRPEGHSVCPSGLDVRAARATVAELLADRDEVSLDHDGLTRLLGCYGIELWDLRATTTREAAAGAAAAIGYPVALKTLAPHLRHRSDLGGVRLDIADEAELLGAFDAMRVRLGAGSEQHFAVQRMAPPGVACVVGTLEDPLLGPVVSFGLGGVATELLDDTAYAIPPLTDTDLAGLVRSVGAAPLLFGHRGTDPVDVRALEDVVARLARLADDVPEVAEISLNPVLVGVAGVSVLTAHGRLARPEVRSDRGPRSLLPG